MIERRLFNKLWLAVDRDYVNIVIGPRHSGKSSLLRALMDRLRSQQNVPANRMFYFDFDDILMRIQFRPNFNAFKNEIEMKLGESLEQLNVPIYLFFDEIQTNPTAFSVLATLFQMNPSKIKLFATSSISLEGNAAYQTNLASNTRILDLLPLSLNELINHNVTSVGDDSVFTAILKGQLDLAYFEQLEALVAEKKEIILRLFKAYVLFGSMPDIIIQENDASRWEMIQTNIRDYFEKDVHYLSQIADLTKYHQILKILSIHNGKLFNILNICDDYGLNRNTVRKYIGTMQETFVLNFVNPYLEDDIKKVVMRTPKLYFQDNGWVHYWTACHQFETLQNTERLQTSLEAVLYQNLMCHAKLSDEQIDIRFIKDYQNHALDFLIYQQGRILPVGICYSQDDQKTKIRNFRYFLKYCSQISQGILFGNFNSITIKEMRGSTLFLLPLWMLW